MIVQFVFVVLVTLATYSDALKGGEKKLLVKPAQALLTDLPGAVPPTGIFDPLGLSLRISDKELKRWQESELKHGRIAMLATIGMLTSEIWNPLFEQRVFGASIYHFQQMQNVFPNFSLFIMLFIGLIEGYSISRGWESPKEKTTSLALLKPDYIPGDLGFDPLGLCPSGYEDANNLSEDFKEMRTKELQNGRLAMLAVAGIVAQELVDYRTIYEHFQTFGFGFGTPR